MQYILSVPLPPTATPKGVTKRGIKQYHVYHWPISEYLGTVTYILLNEHS